MSMYYDTQLVIGPYESTHFTKKEIITRITRYIEAVPTRRMIIWNNQGEEWFEELVKLCDSYRLEPYLWYPVLADRMVEMVPRPDELVRSATLERGYGSLGLWDGFVGNDENFLFRCPEHHCDVAAVASEINETLSRHGFAGVFLDRIRYPSPANGLEMIFSCFCNECLLDGHEEQRRGAATAIDRMVDYCRSSRTMDWSTFVCEGDLKDLMERRSSAITTLVGDLASRIDRSRFSIGLDLLSPAIAPLVGQDYEGLAHCCDWITAMTYTKAIGPAGLPLEARSLVNGLQEAHDDITFEMATRFVQGLLGLARGSMRELARSNGFSTAVLSDEISRARTLAGDGVKITAGIELVNHPVFPTSIPEFEARRMIDAVHAMHSAMVTCWNLLYIPEENYRHLAMKQGENRS